MMQIILSFFQYKGGNANRSVRTSAGEIEDGTGRDKEHAGQERSLRKVCGGSLKASETIVVAVNA